MRGKKAYAFINRGNGHRAKGEYERAIADYDQAIRLDPKYVRPYSNRRWLSRDNLDEKSGNQGENGRIAEPYDDCRQRCRAQAVFALRLTRSVTPMPF